jgi:excisionase family DNA binding protein
MHDSALSAADAPDSETPITPRAVPVPQAAILLGCGIRHTWSLIKTGELPSFKFGRVRRVRVTDIDAYHAKLVEADREQRGLKASA